MPFLSELKVKEATPQGYWELLEPLHYRGNSDTFVIPATFKTNFASVPRPFWWLVSRHGKHTKAAVLHDYLWREANKGEFDRCDADGIFRRAMWELDVSFARRWLMWATVRLGAGPKELFRCGWGQLGLVALITLLAIVLVMPAALVVVGFLFVFWLVELLLFAILVSIGVVNRLARTIAPPEDRRCPRVLHAQAVNALDRPEGGRISPSRRGS